MQIKIAQNQSIIFQYIKLYFKLSPLLLQILVTIGAIETDESKLYAAGHTQEHISQITGKTLGAVNARIPYTKCPYNQLHPTENALRIRKHRTKRKEESEQ